MKTNKLNLIEVKLIEKIVPAEILNYIISTINNSQTPSLQAHLLLGMINIEEVEEVIKRLVDVYLEYNKGDKGGKDTTITIVELKINTMNAICNLKTLRESTRKIYLSESDFEKVQTLEESYSTVWNFERRYGVDSISKNANTKELDITLKQENNEEIGFYRLIDKSILGGIELSEEEKLILNLIPTE